jgi:hypothetical protein
VSGRLLVIEQLRNAEIQQLGHSRRSHQNIRGFEIAMNDEVLMGVVDCAADSLEKLQSRGDVQAIRIAKSIDGDAVNVLHDDIGASVR